MLFRAFHYPETAFRHGVGGMGLTFLYGLVLGYLRERSGGLGGVWISHVAGDLGVFGLVAISSR